MKARRLVSRDKARIEVEEYELPALGEHDVLVRNEYTAVSVGTEIYCWLHGAEPGQVPRFPRLTGYCGMGVVVDRGRGVEEVAVGDRVATQGCHASHQVIGRYYHRLPEAVAGDEGVFLVMAAIAIRGARRGRVSLGEGVVVLGVGIVGQLTLSLCRLCGALPLIAVDVDRARLDRAVKRGADLAVGAGNDDEVVRQVQQVCVGDGADVVLEATGKPAVYPLAARLARTGGRVVALGSPRGTVDMDFMRDVHLREVDLIGAFQPLTPEAQHLYYPWTKDRDRGLLLELMARGSLPVRDLITHRFVPEQCQQAYEMLADRPQEALGVVFAWDS